MNPFSVGDKAYFNSEGINGTREVSKVDGNFINITSNGDPAGWWPASQFKRVEPPKPVEKFKLGDRVVHTEAFANQGVGVVSSLPIGNGFGAAYGVTFKCGLRYCSEKNLKAAPPEVKPAPAHVCFYNHGERVMEYDLAPGQLLQIAMSRTPG